MRVCTKRNRYKAKRHPCTKHNHKKMVYTPDPLPMLAIVMEMDERFNDTTTIPVAFPPLDKVGDMFIDTSRMDTYRGILDKAPPRIEVHAPIGSSPMDDHC